MLEQLFSIMLGQHSPNIFNVSQMKKKKKKVLLVAAAKLLNELPLHIRQVSSVSNFKTLLKPTYLCLVFYLFIVFLLSLFYCTAL